MTMRRIAGSLCGGCWNRPRRRRHGQAAASGTRFGSGGAGGQPGRPRFSPWPRPFWKASRLSQVSARDGTRPADRGLREEFLVRPPVLKRYPATRCARRSQGSARPAGEHGFTGAQVAAITGHRYERMIERQNTTRRFMLGNTASRSLSRWRSVEARDPESWDEVALPPQIARSPPRQAV